MIRKFLLLSGFALLIIQQYILPVSIQVQFVIFFSGIILLGVPHGAADLLVANRYAEDKKHAFNKVYFFTNYLLRIFLFGVVLWFFPIAGNVVFIFFAAYHFGETDLCQFKTNTITGKLFVVSYGLVILGVILLNHFEEVKPLLLQFDAGAQSGAFIKFISTQRYVILSFSGLLFFASTFFYFLTNKSTTQIQGQFLVQFALILFILYNLPMVLGFTFYFILWHSVLSLRNITHYLSKDGLFSTKLIAKQIGLYSLLAMLGVILFGLTGSMFVSNNSMLVYVFLGLAVLTAPHMQIMQQMYKSIRNNGGRANEH
ncbi:MAG: Brp/Blh family beta-carotene 15,15'-dioxygenase [Ferruginibacter sp.]|nr:Brp/Blh family beta-carotene 15,15'-dioxygenase [Ferruginibacter sp.]